MNCQHCGTDNKAGARFCGECGAPMITQASTPVPVQVPKYNPPASALTGIAAQPTVSVATQPVAMEMSTQPTVKPKRKVGMWITIGAIILAAVAGLIIWLVVDANGYKDVAKKFAIAQADGDIQGAFTHSCIDVEMYLSNMMKETCDIYDIEISDMYERLEEQFKEQYDLDASISNIEDYMDCVGKVKKLKLEEEYGEYEVTAEVIYSEEIDEDDLDEYIERMEKAGLEEFVDLSEIKSAYEVKIKVTIDGEKESDFDVSTYKIVRYKGKWKVLDVPNMSF